MLKNEFIHLQSNRLNRDFNVLLLLIPSLIFVFILLVFLYNYQSQGESAQKTQDTFVLGKETELDKR